MEAGVDGQVSPAGKFECLSVNPYLRAFVHIGVTEDRHLSASYVKCLHFIFVSRLGLACEADDDQAESDEQDMDTVGRSPDV
jgi:hypothetical protein